MLREEIYDSLWKTKCNILTLNSSKSCVAWCANSGARNSCSSVLPVLVGTGALKQSAYKDD